MSLLPVKEGSIKDRIICAVVDHSNRLKRNIIGVHAACNDSVLSIALNSLVSEGYLKLNPFTGDYSATDEAIRVQGLTPVARPTESTREKAGEQGGSAPGLNGAKAADTAQPRPADVVHPSKSREAVMAPKQGKKCTFCEETKAPGEFYESQARCKVCFTGIAKVGKLRKEGRPIPSELQRFAGSGGPVQKAAPAKPPAANIPAKPIHVEPAADSSVFRIIPAGIVECRVIGSGKDADAMITQDGKTHLYGLTELQQLRDWATGVLKREMAA